MRNGINILIDKLGILMLLVKTLIGPSTIHGIGLFANEDVPPGTLIWKFEPKFDQILDLTAFKDLRKDVLESILDYCYRIEDKYVLCADNARFMNHADNPNTVDKPGIDSEVIALKNIAKGQEITSNYRIYDDDYFRKILRNFL